jgi:hypothetical protein
MNEMVGILLNPKDMEAGNYSGKTRTHGLQIRGKQNLSLKLPKGSSDSLVSCQ